MAQKVDFRELGMPGINHQLEANVKEPSISLVRVKQTVSEAVKSVSMTCVLTSNSELSPDNQ